VDESALDERLRALAHPVRRLLVAECLEAPRTAGFLVGRCGLAPASVSEHLKVLRKTGLLVLDRDGRFWRYRTDPELVRATSRALEALAGEEQPGRVRGGDGKPQPPGGLVGRPA
jgi:DNA-binding transcriptional ArsR family regulator